ncbi:enoyl-CoA hydratase/isomerase family protein [Massilia putida]|uniref:enoyl-CoA hydratase/isomerase family protein n=1 Tax=Massilia putida TaxID=1141883 RepID=UPI000951F35F|nr:enoyl-CoA hydratase/isomerase family protein [Massilia putida]
MSSRSFVRVEQIGHDGAVRRLRLDRPERANAYHQVLLTELDAALNEARADASVKAIIVTGSGDRAFCSGADRDELRTRGALDGIELFSREVFDRLAELPLPTVACINGAAIGGGLELALACDIRVCSAEARFALPELSLGLTPAAGGVRRLPGLIGHARAAEIILFQRMLDAVTAQSWGLVAECGGDYQARALALAETAAGLDPMAFRLGKILLAQEQQRAQADLESLAQGLLYERNQHRTFS